MNNRAALKSAAYAIAAEQGINEAIAAVQRLLEDLKSEQRNNG